MPRPAPFLLLCALVPAGAAIAQNPPSPGEQLYRQQCQGCHALQPGRNVPGPSLDGIVGRRIAGAPGFDFSDALRAYGARNGSWTVQALDRFLANPERTIPGVEMASAGIADPRARRALIDWLGRQRRPAR